jgi:hypothetical protein
MFLLNCNSILRFWSLTDCYVLDLTVRSFCKRPRNFIKILLIVSRKENILMLVFFMVLVIFFIFYYLILHT